MSMYVCKYIYIYIYVCVFVCIYIYFWLVAVMIHLLYSWWNWEIHSHIYILDIYIHIFKSCVVNEELFLVTKQMCHNWLKGDLIKQKAFSLNGLWSLYPIVHCDATALLYNEKWIFSKNQQQLMQTEITDLEKGFWNYPRVWVS